MIKVVFLHLKIFFRDFLNLLAKKMHEKKLEIGFCISDWGVLKVINKLNYFSAKNQLCFSFMKCMQKQMLMCLQPCLWPTTGVTWTKIRKVSRSYFALLMPQGTEWDCLLLLALSFIFRVQIGIKSVVHEPKDPVTGIIPEKVYDKPGDWTHRKLKDFVRWVSRYTEVTQLHVWPESWGRRSRTKAFFFRTLKGFTKTGVVHQIP